MRSDCRHYESRTYASGEAVRKCILDLAPEAPWNCPADCPRYERRRIDAGWQYGSLAKGMEPAPPEPEVAMSADVAALLDEAEDIVNSAGVDPLAAIVSWRSRRSDSAPFWPDDVPPSRWIALLVGAGAFFVSGAATAFAALGLTRLLDVTLIGSLQPILIIGFAVAFLGEHVAR